MAAPEYVPTPKGSHNVVYQSPPRRAESWFSDRPAELAGGQPTGRRLGHQGPDQGFALKLARRFEGRLVLADGEREGDAIAGCTAVAMRRASMFGRAPMIHDLTVGFTVYGFLAPAPPAQVAMRQPLFDEVAHPHHYEQLRALVDRVPEWALRLPHARVAEMAAVDWQSLFALEPD